MFAAPDVYALAASLDRLVPHLRLGARVVFFSGKRSTRRFGWLLNGLLQLALTKLPLPMTPGLKLEPWSLVAARTCELQIEEWFHGWIFLAGGTHRAWHLITCSSEQASAVRSVLNGALDSNAAHCCAWKY